ncbi:MAG: UPF0147 family protein [Candidatus Bathyarchaeia archaeon]
MPRKKEEYEQRVKQAIELLDVVSNDYMTPRNIRLAAKAAARALRSKTSYGVRAADAISILDEVSQDPNMPEHTRVRMWNIVSALEGIRD